MNKYYSYGFLLLMSALLFGGCGTESANSMNGQTNGSIAVAGEMSKSVQIAEKIEVVHFHATQQCWSCITVGELAQKTIKERFSEEYAKGVIVFKDINGELPANRDIVNKYQAGGSSLFVNAIMAGKDNIQEDTTVWRYVSNEQQFMNYFEAKLKKLLGKK